VKNISCHQSVNIRIRPFSSRFYKLTRSKFPPNAAIVAKAALAANRNAVAEKLEKGFNPIRSG